MTLASSISLEPHLLMLVESSFLIIICLQYRPLVYNYAECHYAECHVLFVAMLIVFMPSVIMLSVVAPIGLLHNLKTSR